ncbi:MAG: SCO family protein [Rhodanobacteraceae bacterium]|nr:SCO family protein [Rhodanobacteraceae bacterium]
MRQLPWIIVLVAAATSFGLWLGLRPSGAPSVPSYAAFSQYPQARTLSPFSLDAADGQPIDATRLAGKYQLVFFGFTHCPDVCPTALAVMREIDRGLPAAKLDGRVGFLFVSVDPERDDLKTLGEYAKFFSPNILAATADHERLGTLTRAMGVLYVREQTESPDYNVDHSAAVFVLDTESRLIGRFSPPLDPAKMLADLQRIAGS